MLTIMDAREFESLVRERLLLVGGKPIRTAQRAGLPRDTIRSVLRGHPPNLVRLPKICDALGLEFYIGLPRPAVPNKIAAALGLHRNATVNEAVAAIDERRNPRMRALLNSWAALQIALDHVNEAAGWLQQDRAPEAAARAREILDYMGLHEDLIKDLIKAPPDA